MQDKYTLRIDVGKQNPYERELHINNNDFISFGRNDNNDIVLPVPTVSAVHGSFYAERGRLAVWDLGSKNGVFVNGSRITISAFLQPNDRITLCQPGFATDASVTMTILLKQDKNNDFGDETVIISNNPICPVKRARMGKKLVLHGQNGRFSGKCAEIGRNGRIIIGRNKDKCSLIYPADEKVISNIHCMIFYNHAQDSFILLDHNSTNGTYVGGGGKLPPQELHVLANGEEFFLANRNQVFHVEIDSGTKLPQKIKLIKRG